MKKMLFPMFYKKNHMLNRHSICDVFVNIDIYTSIQIIYLYYYNKRSLLEFGSEQSESGCVKKIQVDVHTFESDIYAI